jgi:hypothetical protein
MPQARKTSRKPVQVGKWTPRAKRADRLHKSMRRGTSTRRGRLSYKHVRAAEFKGNDRLFKGRIALDRKSGVLEFPNYEQFKKIARDEKIPADLIEDAFGHMAPEKAKRKTSRRRSTKRKKPRRRTSRKKKGIAAWLGLTGNPAQPRRRRIRRDDVFVPRDMSGEEVPLRAQAVLIPQAQVGGFGAQRGIYMAAAGQTIILPYERAFQILERWLTKQEFQKAFGHLKPVGVLGETEQRRPIPTHFGPRSMRLGHRMPPGEGPALPGIVQGQLVLYHKPTGSIMWQAYDDEANSPDKPVWIWFGAHKRHFGFDKAMSGAKVGSGDRSQMIGAVDRGIPEMAMLQAFGLLLKPEVRHRARSLFSTT